MGGWVGESEFRGLGASLMRVRHVIPPRMYWYPPKVLEHAATQRVQVDGREAETLEHYKPHPAPPHTAHIKSPIPAPRRNNPALYEAIYIDLIPPRCRLRGRGFCGRDGCCAVAMRFGSILFGPHWAGCRAHKRWSTTEVLCQHRVAEAGKRHKYRMISCFPDFRFKGTAQVRCRAHGANSSS